MKFIFQKDTNIPIFLKDQHHNQLTEIVMMEREISAHHTIHNLEFSNSPNP